MDSWPTPTHTYMALIAASPTAAVPEVHSLVPWSAQATHAASGFQLCPSPSCMHCLMFRMYMAAGRIQPAEFQ